MLIVNIGCSYCLFSTSKPIKHPKINMSNYFCRHWLGRRNDAPGNYETKEQAEICIFYKDKTIYKPEDFPPMMADISDETIISHNYFEDGKLKITTMRR